MDTTLVNKLELTELGNKLFMYTDAQDWEKLKGEVFAKKVWFDMKSISGAEPEELDPDAICTMWQKGFEGLDAVHHQAVQYLISIIDNAADIYAYAIAIHYNNAATQGKTRSFTGSYHLKAVNNQNGWRINQFKYNLKIADGNIELT